MKHVFLKKAKEVFLLCFLAFLLPLPSVAGQFISSEDSLLDERAVGKMEEIAQELFKTTGVKAFLVAKKSAQGKEIVAFEKEFTHDIQPPFVLLTLFLEEKKVDVYASKDLEKAFDKEALLSPLPWKGTIIPLLTTKKKEVGVTPALLNGYADLTDQIAAFYHVTLQNSIGSANKTTISLVRMLVYGFVGSLLIFVFIRRIRKNG